MSERHITVDATYGLRHQRPTAMSKLRMEQDQSLRVVADSHCPRLRLLSDGIEHALAEWLIGG
jgi:hypothetical protein